MNATRSFWGGEDFENRIPAMIRTTRGALGALGAAFLLGTLVFLFVKTAGIDFQHDSHALSLLREMKDLDTHWDEDAARIANDFAGTAAPQADFSAMMARTLQEIERGASREAFRKDLAQLRNALGEKEAAFKAFRAAHQRSAEAGRAMGEALRSLAQVGAARAAGSRSGRNLPATAEQLRSDINRRLETFALRAPSIEQRVATLRAESVALDPALAESGGAAENAGRAFLAARAAEGALFSKFSFLTLGGRIDLSARTLSKVIEDALDEKERWRVYLFVYALALLIATG